MTLGAASGSRIPGCVASPALEGPGSIEEAATR